MCTYRDNAMDRAGELPPDFRTAVEIEWSKGKTMDERMSKPLENFSAAEVAPQSSAAVRGEAAAVCPYCGGKNGVHDSAYPHPRKDYGKEGESVEMTDIDCERMPKRAAFIAWAKERDFDVSEFKDSWGNRMFMDANIRMIWYGWFNAPVSARAADAPSEPSEPVAVGIDSISLRAASKMMCFVYKSMPEYSLKAKLQTAVMDAMEEYRPYSSVSAHLANPPSEPIGLPPISASTYGSKTTCELEQFRRTQRVVPDNLPRWIDSMKGSDPTIDSLIEYIIWQSRAADALSEPSELSNELREYASNSGYSHNDYADIMRRAADALDSQPTEWNDAINAATGLLEKMGDSLGDHADYNHCEMTCCDSTRMHALSDAASAVFGLAREVSSQPTDDKRDDLIARLRNQVDTLTGRLFDFESKNGPNTSSQPSDGGVRND